MRMQVTRETTIGQLCESGDYAPFSNFFFTKMTDDVWNNTLEHYGFEKCGFIPTLDRLWELRQTGGTYVYPVYDEEEIHAEPDKEAVKLIHMPGGEGKPYVLVCPGGAYARQWGFIEGLAIGARLNELGYTAMILYYRTWQNPPFTEALMPKPIEDLDRGIRWIKDHEELLQIKTEGFAIAGFSAGAHLAAEWGTLNLGWQPHRSVKPAALILGYPSITSDLFYDDQAEVQNPYLLRLTGPDCTRERLRVYNIDQHMDETYPPVYLTACKDDPVVPIKNSFLMKEMMDKLGIPYQANIAEKGGHSFGVADQTELDGWLQQAVHFWEQQREHKF